MTLGLNSRKRMGLSCLPKRGVITLCPMIKCQPEITSKSDPHPLRRLDMQGRILFFVYQTIISIDSPVQALYF